MATDIRPVSESGALQNVNIDRDRPEKEKVSRDEKTLFSDKVSADEAELLIGELNDAMRIMNTKLSFSIDTATKRPVIQVLDLESGELIRQIPPEEMQRVSQRINDVLGVLFDERG